MSPSIRRASCAVAALMTAVSPLSASIASAQAYPPAPSQGYPQDYPQQSYPQQGYPQQSYPQQNYPQQNYPQQNYQGAPQPGYDAPPPGYDGSQPPPPPPGYQADQYDNAQRVQDQRYQAYAEDWSQRYCYRARSNAGAGAVIGGLFGALLGSSIAGRHDRGAGAIVGGIAGAAGGAAIGSTSANDTSPGCPPGYVVRNDAPAFTYDGYGDSYYYAAPGWYRPWYFYEGRWSYRPYPYHTWYYRNYGYGRPYGGYRGGYGGGYGGGGYRHRHW